MMASPTFNAGGGNETRLLYDYESLLNMSSLFRQDDEACTRDMLTYYIMGVGGMTICCLGFVGNMVSLVVLTQRSMRSSTYSYLSALAICDSLMLLLTIILLVKDVNKPVKDTPRWAWDEGIYPYLFPYVHPGAFTFQVTSVWLTLAFTVDRYIMICHPFKAEPFCSVPRARKVICSLYILALLFNLPKFFEYATVIIHLPIRNETKIGWDLTSFGRSHIFRELYHSWFYITFVCGVPFLALAMLNGCLMHAVHLSRLRGREINAAEKKRNDTTIMLISVVVVFFICQMPALVSRTIWAFEPDQKAFHKLPLYTLNEIGNLLIITNSSINIVPYYFFGRRFRRNFWKLFCRCLSGYEKFQKMSRSFSLTVFDQRRLSQAGNNTVLIDRLPSPFMNRQATPSKGTLLSLHDNQARSTTLGSDESLTKSNSPLYKKLTGLDTQVNGNCVNGSREKIRRVGVTQQRYVAHVHLSPWLVHSYKNVRGRASTEKKTTGASEPFDFAVSGETEEVANSGDVQFKVPPPPLGETMLSEHLPTPKPDRYKVLSLVRSAIIEDKCPGTEDYPDLNGDTNNQTEMPTCTENGSPVEVQMEVDQDKSSSENEENSEFLPPPSPDEALLRPSSPVPSTSTAPATVAFQPRVRVRLPRPMGPVARPMALMGPRIRLPVTQLFPGPVPIPMVANVGMETQSDITSSSDTQSSAESMKEGTPEYITPEAINTTVTTSEFVNRPMVTTMAVTSPVISRKTVIPSLTTAKAITPEVQTASVSVSVVETAIPVTPNVITAKPFTSEVTIAKGTMLEVKAIKTITPVMTASNPLTPEMIAIKHLAPTVRAAKPVTPTMTNTKIAMPAVQAENYVLPTVTAAKSITQAVAAIQPGSQVVTAAMPFSSLLTTANSVTPIVTAVTVTKPSIAPEVIPPGANIPGQPSTLRNRLSETMALYTKSVVSTRGVANKDSKSGLVADRTRTDSASESGVGPKVARIPSILSTRGLPSLGGLGSRRVRTVSECSEGKQAETQGTMLRLLEGITESFPSVRQLPDESTSSQHDEEAMDTSQPLKSIQQYKTAQISIKDPSLMSRRQKGISPHGASHSQIITPNAMQIGNQFASSAPSMSPHEAIASTSKFPISGPVISLPPVTSTKSVNPIVTTIKTIIPPVTAAKVTTPKVAKPAIVAEKVATANAVMPEVTAIKPVMPTLRAAKPGSRSVRMAKPVPPTVTSTKTAIPLVPVANTVMPTVTATKPSTQSHFTSEGGTGPKFVNKSSILSTRGLSSLENLGSRRVRTVSERSDGNQAESQGTMLQQLEGITESIPSARRLPGESRSQHDEEAMDTSQSLMPTDSGWEQYQTAEISVKDPPLASRRQKALSPHGVSHSQMISPQAMQTRDQFGSSIHSISPCQIISSTSKSPLSSPVQSPKLFSKSQPFRPLSPRSPRALTNQAILDILQEPDTASRSTVGSQHHISTHLPVSSMSRIGSPIIIEPMRVEGMISPKARASPAILSSLQMPIHYPISPTSPLSSPMNSPEISLPIQSKSPIFSSIREALMSPVVQTLGYSSPRPSAVSGITPIASRLPPQPIRQVQSPPMRGLPIPQALNPNVPRTAQQVEESQRIRDSLATQIARSGAGSTQLSDTSAAQTQLGPDKSSFIELPVQNLPGYDSVKHMLKKGTEDTVRIKLPPGFKIPDARTPVRFSIISEEQAQKMGITLPSTGSPKAQVAASGKPAPTTAPPSRPSAAAGSAVSGPNISLQSSSQGQTQLSNRLNVPSDIKEEDFGNIPQVDGSDDGRPPPSRKRPLKAQGSVPCGSRQQFGVDANVDSDESANKDSSDESSRQKCNVNRRPGAVRYSAFPKFKGRTPESTYHRLYQPVHLIPRPWRQTDGLVNKPTLKLMLESVLILIMSRPGITQQDVTAQYNPILQPVPVLELLEILEDIGCVHALQISGSHKPSLFSERVRQAYDTSGVEKVYVPSVDCVLKLGQFEDQLKAVMSAKMRAAMETDAMKM